VKTVGTNTGPDVLGEAVYGPKVPPVYAPLTLQDWAFVTLQEICTVLFLRTREGEMVSVPSGFAVTQDPAEHICAASQAVVVTLHHGSVVLTVVLSEHTLPALAAQGGSTCTHP
jgi:hypothetical protein